MVKGRGVIVARSWEEEEDMLMGREWEGGEIWEVLIVLVVVDVVDDDGDVLGRDGTVYRDRVRNLRKSRRCKGDKNIDRLESFA